MNANRRLTFEIFRFNPEDPASTPNMQSFEIDAAPYMTLYIALNLIRETLDPSLQFDFACRSNCMKSRKSSTKWKLLMYLSKHIISRMAFQTLKN